MKYYLKKRGDKTPSGSIHVEEVTFSCNDDRCDDYKNPSHKGGENTYKIYYIGDYINAEQTYSDDYLMNTWPEVYDSKKNKAESDANEDRKKSKKSKGCCSSCCDSIIDSIPGLRCLLNCSGFFSSLSN